MEDIRKIKRQMAIYGFLFIVLCEIVSFFIIGFGIWFPIFLLAGLVTGLVNFNIIEFFLKRMLDNGNAGLSTLSLIIRILIYCVVFYIAVQQGIPSGLACLLGFLAPKLPLYYFNAIKKPDLKSDRKLSPEMKAMYEAEDKEREDGGWGK